MTLAPALPRPTPAGRSPARPTVPPLENGDRLTRAEFHRRYEAMPDDTRAQLIEGVVHVCRRVNARLHGNPHFILGGVLGRYLDHTPDLDLYGIGSTVLLDDANEPEPDLLVSLPPHLGGLATISEDDYVVGPPTLIAEVALSAASVELHAKLDAYRRSGVAEYLVWRTLDAAVDYFLLRGDRYDRLAPDPADGLLKSPAFPGLWLDADALTARDLPRLLAAVDRGCRHPRARRLRRPPAVGRPRREPGPLTARAYHRAMVAIHDWTRVDARRWYGFHLSWVVELCRALNAGVLPADHYADPEQPTPPPIPGLRMYRTSDDPPPDDADEPRDTAPRSETDATEVAEDDPASPRLSLRLTAPLSTAYAGAHRTIAVRHESDDRLVALVELASPSDKDRPHSVAAFTDRVAGAVERGVHVSVIDLLPPRRPDGPGGLIARAAEALGTGDPSDLGVPPGKPLMVGAFDAARPPTLHAEPLSVGDALPDLPVFLRPGRPVAVPLAATYAAAWAATPRRWRAVVEG